MTRSADMIWSKEDVMRQMAFIVFYNNMIGENFTLNIIKVIGTNSRVKFKR